MKNLFYFRKINAIGGTEQFLYEIAKKYNDYDITVLYDEADIEVTPDVHDNFYICL